MPESAAATTDLTSQYATQVAADLERNATEQERISADIAALQQQLTALQHDHAVLVTMQQALGTVPAAVTTAAEPGGTTVPAPREDAAPSGTKRRAQPKKSAGARARTSDRKPAARKPSGKTTTGKTDKPTLVELVRRHLAEQSEPRSAAEIATALDQAHPERRIKTTVVRTTVEGLVARNQAHRTKQGTSVYYTAPDDGERTPQPPAEGEDRAGSEPEAGQAD
ncbi:hypothetical protein GCM10010145_21360 [Streptomyces ruber]|uniref:Regulatory protein n=2 Tax=Streptomyces TaxID=1883 RepID=A0A918ES61_9ACTN|nr:hypothetical protein [Streptomyces ruber]GGQ51748.1 hypothetical protein GCM10010145_21360 [Streptomyces ruber]